MADVTTTERLYEFIDRALKNRKYLPNVATNFRTPIRLIEKELSNEENHSLEVFVKNLDAVFGLIYSKSNNTLSASSLETYKKRILQVVSDYEKYGKDASAMASWDRKIVVRKPKPSKLVSNTLEKTNEILSVPQELDSSMTKHEEILTHGKSIIFTPSILEHRDINILKAYIDYLEKKISDKEVV